MQKRFVSAGSDNVIRIWSLDDEEKKWVDEESIRGHDDWVRDVAWAPNIGLPGMYIASASQVSGRALDDEVISTGRAGSNSLDTFAPFANVTLDVYASAAQCSQFSGSPFPRRRVARQLVAGWEYFGRQLR